VKLSEGYETFWAYIPHFIHSPFYVYAYAFGDCLVNSLYSVYQNARTVSANVFRHAQGRRHQASFGTARPFGLDASDPGFWNQGLSMIEGMIDELEAMDG
jgi:oligoendopeptidase F